MRVFRPKNTILLEPRISKEVADRVCNKLGKKRWVRSEAMGFNGGVWVIWDDEEILVRLKATHRSFLHMEVRLAEGR